MLRVVIVSYGRLRVITISYSRLRVFTVDYEWLQKVTSGYIVGYGGYSRLLMVTVCCGW